MAYDGELKFDTRIDKTGFKLGLSSLGNLASQGMAAVASAVTTASSAVVALGGYAVTVGKNFESSMSQVIATMGITKDTVIDGVNSYDLLKEAAAAAGEATVFSASEAADALNYLALAGYDAVKAADALPAVLNLASAGGMDLAYASDLATDAMAALGIEATSENLTRFGDELAKTASTANASVSQLGEAILTVGGTAKSLAGGTTELNAALGVLANRGIKGSEGGTALRNIILALTAPTDKAAESMDALGLAVLDAEGNMRPLNEIFKDLDDILSEMSEGEKTAVLNDIFNKVDLKSAQALLAGCGEEFDNLTEALAGCDGAMAQMAETMNDNLEGDLKSLESKAEAFGIAVYDDIQEPLRSIAQLGGEYITQLTDAFQEGEFEGLAKALGFVLGDTITKVSTVAPKLIDIGITVVNSFVTGITKNIDAIALAGSQISAELLNSLFILSPQIISAGIELCTALASGISESAPELVEAANSGIKQVLTAITENLPEFIDSAIQIISAMISGLISSVPEIVNAAVLIIETLASGIADNIGYIVSSAIAIISALCTHLLTTENIEKLMKAAYDILISITTAILDNLDELIAVALNVITFLCTELISSDNIQTLIETGLEILLAIVDAIVDNSDELISAALTVITTLVDELLKQENLEKLISAGAELLVQIIIGLCQLTGKFTQFATDLFLEIGTAIGSIDWASIGISIIEGICSGLLDIDFKMDEYLGEFADNWVNGVKDIFGIHSPSRLMRETVGKPLAEGVGVGFVENIPDVEQDALAAFDRISKTVSHYTFTPNVDTAGIINNTDNHSVGDTNITEEIHYHIYTQASKASDASEIAEELEFLRKQEKQGKGQ